MKVLENRETLLNEYSTVRRLTKKICTPLLIEDYVIQSIEDVSPPKWHLAHTSWFFETFLLTPYLKNYELFHPLFPYLFNSYYQSLGHPFPRVRRGVLSRPSVEAIYQYRAHVDQWMQQLLLDISDTQIDTIQPLMTLGLNHEQQHQELLLTDIKYNFSLDPTWPCYHPRDAKNDIVPVEIEFLAESGGLIEIGCHQERFCFDNEIPRHKVYLEPYALASRLVTNAEYLSFISAGGYSDPKWWLADGWNCVQKQNWNAPLYWHYLDGAWFIFTLSGLKKLNPYEPVVHVSFYEADAYARFKGARLPNEAEWEHHTEKKGFALEGNFLETETFHPEPYTSGKSQQFFGDVWEWTSSAYAPYPGYQPLNGALGEYNGKFMCNQMVLRGGSCVTPKAHIRASYRNFFQPDKRWQFSGIRLAKNI